MPRSSKKQKLNNEPESSSSPSSSDNNDDQEEFNRLENIQLDLEARSPIDTDHTMLVYFLEQSFGNSIKKSILDLKQLATQLVTQQSCGSVFYQVLDSTLDETDDDDNENSVLGICSFLRFNQQQNKQIYEWLLDKCSNSEQAKTILQCKLICFTFKKKKKKPTKMDELGFEPKTFRMQSEHSTAELHAR